MKLVTAHLSVSNPRRLPEHPSSEQVISEKPDWRAMRLVRSLGISITAANVVLAAVTSEARHVS